MKRIFHAISALVLSFVLAASLSSCTDSSQEGVSVPYENAEALLAAVWEKDDDANKPKIIGGVGENAVMDTPAALDLSDPALLSASLSVPEGLVENAESAASIMNAMMANAFCASVWQLKDAASAQEWAPKVSDAIASAQWMCTSPEVYKVYTCQSYVIAVYGYSDQVDGFADAVMSALESYGVKEEFSEIIEN